MIERIVRVADFHKNFMLLAYADDIDIIGLNRRAVTAALEKEESSEKEDKTKEAARMEPSVSVDNYTFEVVNSFVNLGTSIIITNNVSLEIKRRLTLANRCSYRS